MICRAQQEGPGFYSLGGTVQVLSEFTSSLFIYANFLRVLQFPPTVQKCTQGTLDDRVDYLCNKLPVMNMIKSVKH